VLREGFDVAGSGAVGVGLVGLGYWGPNHLRVLQESEQAELRWICDADPRRVDLFGSRTQAGATTDLERVLSDPRTDAVIVATPISTHYEIARRCLEAGKHVLVEKPLAGSAEEADELIELADRRGLAIMCGHTFLFSPPVIAIREMIQRGDLGEIYFISSSRVNLGLHQRDVSVLWDLAPHDYSILLHWLGESPRSVSVAGRDSIVSGTPDVAFATLAFPDGLLANVELSWLAPSKLRRTVLVGSEKMVVYDDTSQEQVRVFDHGVVYRDPESFGEFQLSYRTGDILSPKLGTEEPLATQLSTFVEAVGQERAPEDHTRVGRDVVALVEASERSLTNGGISTPVASRHLA
jgi:predicted dehydrogenase